MDPGVWEEVPGTGRAGWQTSQQIVAKRQKMAISLDFSNDDY